MPSTPTDCALARESVSVQLDGELPELELDRLETHLRFCPECSSWAEQVRNVTFRLREACAEVPEDRLVLPRHTRRWRVSSAVALTAAAAVVATMFFAPGQRPSVGARHGVSQVSRLAGGNLQPVLASGLTRREDGRFIPTATPPVTFRPD